MAFEDNQLEPALPGGNKNYKRKVKNHLPKYFRTQFNNKFLNATLDRLMQPGVAEKINGYYGRKNAKAFSSTDTYIGDITDDRENYQLEPASIIKDELGNIKFYADYNDYINTLKLYGNDPINHNDTNSQEYYSWNPHIDWDKFVNFREYYWMPVGPAVINVAGQSKDVQSTYTIGLKNNADNITYLFTPDGVTDNPTIKLFRGQKYRFEIDTPNYPIAFATNKSFIPGSTTLVETQAGVRSQGNFDLTLYKTDENTDLIYSTGIQNFVYETGFTEFNDEGFFSPKTIFVEKGVIEFTVPENAPDYLYYISQSDPNVSGLFRINDIIENTEIDVEKEIIGKKTYTTTNNWNFSNGMKVKFVGNVLSEKYASGEWYVEGVGKAIKLIHQEDLLVSGLFTSDIEVEFDGTRFDFYPFSEALGFPVAKDYITINKSSGDGNLWSKYNRWIHKDVIKKSLELNGQAFVLDQAARAKRPIIEFNDGIRLHNFGTHAKQSIDLIDTFTTDAFSIVEGSLGYNIDSVDLVAGMRIMFVADTDPMVYGKIYKVKLLTVNNRTQITLIEDEDTDPLIDETVLVTKGTLNGGKIFYYNGTQWKTAQAKTKVNQSPLFDMYDGTDIQFNDSVNYQYSQFNGNKIFCYADAVGTNDEELGFPVLYKNIVNTGDIVFSFDLVTKSFVYNSSNQVLTQSTDQGFVRIYNDRTQYQLSNGWAIGEFDSSQNVIKQEIAAENQEYFALDMYDETDFLDHAWYRIYKNNVIQKKDTDYVIYANANDRKFLQFLPSCKQGDVILIKIRSKYQKNNNGYYEIPGNLEKNPLNNNLTDFTLGEVNDHLSTIVEEIDNFDGVYPGLSNIRDLGEISKYGKKFQAHSALFNLVSYHLSNESSNVISAVNFAKTEYSKFKRNFLTTADTLGFDGRTKPHVDNIIAQMNIDKTSDMPFYFSDMLPQVGVLTSSTTLVDTDQTYFPLNQVFSQSELGKRAVSVYRNGNLSLYGIDYTFDVDGFVVYTGYKQVDDVIEIYEYDSTHGSYIPPTPTKLGLYPKFTPKIYIDTFIGNNGQNNPTVNQADTYAEIGYVDSGYSFSYSVKPFQIYGQPVGNQYNSDSAGWAYPCYTNILDAKNKDTALGGSGQAVLYKFEGLDRPFFMPTTDQNIGQYESNDYEKWDEGIVIIQGHDGSRIPAFLDYKDNLLLELEKRIYNNCKMHYDTTFFDINDFIDGLYRKVGGPAKKLNNALLSDFIDWTQLVNGKYSDNIYFDLNNSSTYNYGTLSFSNAESMPGWINQIYRYVYDTDRPNTHPWEMLGFSQEPSWWQTQYGKPPYTSNNLIMWEDLSKGIIRQPTFTINSKYIRPDLLEKIPVDADGNLRSPSQANLPYQITNRFLQDGFKFGDGAPIENAWRHSSDYPFSLLKSFIINKPCKVFATAFDRSRQKRNIAGQLVYGDTTGTFIKLSNLIFPNTVKDTNEVYTSGLINYIIEYKNQEFSESIEEYKEEIKSITNQLAFKIGGFTEKEKFKIILDSRTPLNQGNVFIPENNYKIFSNSSAVVKEIVYSGVIIEKQAAGFYVKGYDSVLPNFKYHKPIPKTTDPVINVGGVSAAFITWDVNKFYATDTIVKNSLNSKFYRCIETHTSTGEIDLTKFVELPELPTQGGVALTYRKVFEDNVSTLNYDTLFTEIQDVVDFLLGYGQYLELQGFSFSTFNENVYEVSDWFLSANQFVFWTTQNWAAGAVISLSPGAGKINFQDPNFTVGNVISNRNNYSILKANGKTLGKENLRFFKDDDNTFSAEVINTTSGIYLIKLPLITTEHTVLLDNKTDFNDTIYNITPGYRQDRIKVAGYRTAGWNGSVNLSGFVYDDATLTEWKQWNDYAIGSLVKHKEFYYIARRKIAGSLLFDSKEWYQLDAPPESSLLPNFDYKVKQFTDFYSLDSDNFDSEQQKMAQHLIGYQKRKYLQNIINDDVSQYKFYQGYIQEKGTRNSLTKLFDVLASANKDSLEFYEEWAIRDGQYGATDTFEEVEYILDEDKFKLTPQPILLTDYITGRETDLIYRIPKYEVYTAPVGYDHKPFPTTYIQNTYVKNSGYVHPDDVTHILGTYDDILTIDPTLLKINDYVWVGNVDKSWNVYKFKNAEYIIDNIVTFDHSTDTFGVELTETPINLQINDIVYIQQITKINYDDSANSSFSKSIVQGFFKIKSIILNVIEFESTSTFVGLVGSEKFGSCTGIFGIFNSVRVADFEKANRLAENHLDKNDKIWIDKDGNEKWTVLQNQNNFVEGYEVTNPESGSTKFANSYDVESRNTILVIGAENDGNGKVYIYNRAAQNQAWQLSEILEPNLDIATSQSYGRSVCLSADGRYLIVGAPTASNVKTKFIGSYSTTASYNADDVVSYANRFWAARSNFVQDLSNITFSSFQNYNDIFTSIGLDASGSEDIPFLLTGNYPFTESSSQTNTIDHYLIKAPKNVYDAITINDTIVLNWNQLTNANQTQTSLLSRQPFNGTVSNFNETHIDGTHTITAKVETILTVNNYINLPVAGDVVTSGNSAGRIAYRHQLGSDVTMYINDVSGNFTSEPVKDISIGTDTLIGTYVVQAPTETTDTSAYLFGYLMIPMPNDSNGVQQTYNISAQTPTINDSGRGLVITDIIRQNTTSTRYYYNVLDTKTVISNSFNTDHSLLVKISGQSGIGPFNSTVKPISSYWMLRVPKALSDSKTVGDSFAIYFNNLAKTVSTLKVKNISINLPPTLVVGETLTQENTGASAQVYSTNVVVDELSPINAREYTIELVAVSSTTFNFADRLIGSQSGDVDIKPVSLPVITPLIQPSDISIPNNVATAAVQTIYDVWDGYIDYEITEFFYDGNPFEPIAKYVFVENSDLQLNSLAQNNIGQIVRDRNTGATAEVLYYQRNGNSCRIYVRNVIGTWSIGEDFGDTQEIEMTVYAAGPNPDLLGRPNIYTVDRTLGKIKSVSLGYDSAGIGKLFVFQGPLNQPFAETIDANTGELLQELKGLEYWFYTQTTLSGVTQNIQIPNDTSLSWIPKYKLEVDSTATATNYQNLGICYVYQRTNANFILTSILLPSEFKSNHYFGTKSKVTSYKNLRRGFILASDGETVSEAGKMYFFKDGVDNNITYAWEFAKNKKFRGEFSTSTNYLTGDIVYIDNTSAGQLYTAKTNITAGVFDIQSWSLNNTLIDYVGSIPNTTSFTVRDDSDTDSALDTTQMYDFGTDFDISDDGEVLIVVAKYTSMSNKITVYRNNNGFYQWSQNLTIDDATAEYGRSVSINNDGTTIVVGAPAADTIKLDQGAVYVYSQVNGVFTLQQTLYSPQNTQAELFGYKVSCDKNKIIVNAKNGGIEVTTTFDKNTTLLDQQFTYFAYENDDNGTIYVYEKTNNTYVYGDQLSYTTSDSTPIYYFGRSCLLINNHIYTSLPSITDSEGKLGKILDYNISGDIYQSIRNAKDTVDVKKIKRIILYNKKTKKLLKYLDYIDPLQGKIAGVAEQNLSYKLYYDPAVYTSATMGNLRVDQTDRWDAKNVGKLWWDLNNSKFYYPYQGDVTFAVNYWGDSFLSNTADIYEWVESDYLPSQWDALADTNEGLSQGISGTTKYGDSAYSSIRKYDSISQTFSNKYFYWVKNKKTIPQREGRTLSSESVSNLILNPADQGYQFVGLINNDKFAIYNCEQLLENKDVIISFQYYTSDNHNQNVHTQYSIITDNYTSKPKSNIDKKWIDSLVGFDTYGRPVPDYTLPEKEKYGNLFKPRQSWFVNREEALKQYIERVNRVLQNSLIIDSKDLTPLTTSDPYPASTSRVYDVKLDTLEDLNVYGVSNFKPAVLSTTTQNGKIIEVVITDPGRGYLVVPTYTIVGNGTDAELEFTINENGALNSVTIVNQGKNYPITTQIQIRKFAVLIENDESLNNKWAIYEREILLNKWQRIQSQGFNVNLYWEYIDWYQQGYNSFTEINYNVDYSYQLYGLEDNIGDIVKINYIGSGGWLLLLKIDNQVNVDYTVNYSTIGRQSGTIKFKESLYNSSVSYNNFDLISFDTQMYDGIPSTEIRTIIETIRDNIFTNEFLIEYNKLFFASIRYVLAEQNYVDWIFKTSFVRAIHNVGEFVEDSTFNNANLPSYQEYVNEVKPFKAKIREYISSYEKLEPTATLTTDFDLAPQFNPITNSIEPFAIKYQNGMLTGSDVLTSYPEKSWIDNIGVGIKEIQVSDGGTGYQNVPKLKFTSTSGTGLEAEVSLGSNGVITAVNVKNSGYGYLAAPEILIQGTQEPDSVPAKLSVILDKPSMRSLLTGIKFDRVSGQFEILDLNVIQNFTASGSKYILDLTWPIDLNKNNITVTVDNIDLLTSEYSYTNVIDATKTYNRYFGRITLTLPPASGKIIKVVYKKNIDLLSAADRINLFYNPSVGQYGKDVSQLMDGVDYGGVEVKSFDFGKQSGWDEADWFAGEYDTYDTTYVDHVHTFIERDVTISTTNGNNIITTQNKSYFVIGALVTASGIPSNTFVNSIGSTGPNFEITLSAAAILTGTNINGTLFYNKTITLSSALESTVEYHLYKNGIRLDDPAWVDSSSVVSNPNAIMKSITGDGTTTVVNLEQLGIITVPNDTIIVRKNTSDGSFLPTNIDYDTILSGGALNYSNATGVAAEDIVVDGEGFITPVNCKGPEEVVPGQVQDTLDIQVFERPTGGCSEIITHNFSGDGTTKTFLINDLFYEKNIIVKIDNVITDQFTFDHSKNTLTFILAPSNGSKINITTLGYSGIKFLDIDKFVADGNTSSFLTNIRYSDAVTGLVTIDGKIVDHTIRKSDDSSFDRQDNVVINVGNPPQQGKIVKFALFDGTIKDYSIVAIDNFTYTDSSQFSLSQNPFTVEPDEWQILVKVNNKILNAGYVETFTLTEVRQYRLKLHQVAEQSVNNNQLRVFLNNKEINYLDDWTFQGSSEYNPLLADDSQSGSTITLNVGVGDVGDKLKIYINGLDDSTPSGGDYRFGYFEADGTFIKTPGILHVSTSLSTNDKITVYQFSNNDSQRLDRQSFDIKERTELTPGTFVNTSTHIMDGSTAVINLDFELIGNRKYAIFKNNIRLDDPNYGTAYQLNNNAIINTIIGNGTKIINLNNLGITVVDNDYIEIAEIDADFAYDSTTADWYEFRQIRNGIIPLEYPVIDDQYVWVILNGVLLDASVDYYALPSKQQIKVLKTITDNDTLEVLHFSNTKLKSKYGWRQFKDILNRNHYKALAKANGCALAKDLNWYDRSIEVINHENLPVPNENSKYPGVLFINGERIEYFIKDGNLLKQLRRGTLGTGIKDNHSAGTEIIDQSVNNTVPYKDETITTIFTGDGSTSIYSLDFTPVSGVNGFEVFVAGKRLRKNSIQSYQLDTLLRTSYGTSTETVSQDSPEGDITLPAEFTLTSSNELQLLNTPETGQKIIVIRKQGKQWSDTGVSLSNSNSDIVNFLQSKQVDLPR